MLTIIVQTKSVLVCQIPSLFGSLATEPVQHLPALLVQLHRVNHHHVRQQIKLLLVEVGVWLQKEHRKRLVDFKRENLREGVRRVKRALFQEILEDVLQSWVVVVTDYDLRQNFTCCCEINLLFKFRFYLDFFAVISI